MRPFYFAGLLLIGLSVVAWAIRPVDRDQRVTLVWVSDDAPTRRLTVELFKRLHPEIDLRLDPQNGGMEKIIVQSLAGVGPDLFDVFFPSQLASYVKAGIAGDITDDLKARGIDVLQDAWPIVRRQVSLDGRVYGVPANASADALWFNKQVFDDAGVPYPDHLQSWNDVVQLAQRMTQRDSTGRITRYGLSFDDSSWMALLRSFGGRWFNESGTHCTLDSPQALAALSLIHDLIFQYHVAPSPADQEAAAQEGGFGNYGQKSLSGGYAAMSIGGRWWLLTMRKNPSLRLGATMLPLTPGGRRSGNGKGTLLNANSKHRAEAMVFLEFLANEDYNRLINQEADAMGGFPKFATDANLNNPKYPNEDFHGVFRQVMREAIPIDQSPYLDFATADKIINLQLDLARRDAKSPEAALRDAARLVDVRIQKSIAKDPALRARYEAAESKGSS